MARKIKIFLIDDLDGSEAASTVRFGLDGVQFEIDLNTAHAQQLRQILTHYAENAREVTGAGWPPAGPAGKEGKPSAIGLTSREIREWATARGITVKARGRVPADVVARFRASAHR